MKFNYKQRVKVVTKDKTHPSFYEGEVGHIVAKSEKKIPGEKAVFYWYLVQIDDKFEVREMFREADLEDFQ
jgi:hypothetical protein